MTTDYEALPERAKWDKLSRDNARDVQLIAISAAGEYLRSNFDRRLLEKLLSIFEQELEPRWIAIRQGAYFALARVAGRDWKQLPSVAHFDFDHDVDPEVLRQIRERLGGE